MENICVFAGASSGKNNNYKLLARYLGKLIALGNMQLIYGGGKIGLMGETASSCLSYGGKVTGIIPKLFMNYKFEVAHENLTNLIITKNMHERKKLMYDKADKFFILPGGLGTLDELMEVLTWKQIGIMNKEVYIVNIDKYWDPLITLIHNILENNFMDKENLSNFKVVSNKNQLSKILIPS